MNSDAGYVKVVARLPRDEDGYLPFETEGLWALPEPNDLYRINNVPFYAYGVSNDDLVSVVRDAELGLLIEDIREPSEFSTVRVWVHDASGREDVRARFVTLGCDAEPAHEHLISLSIPRARLEQVMSEIEEGERANRWEWEEGVLRY